MIYTISELEMCLAVNLVNTALGQNSFGVPKTPEEIQKFKDREKHWLGELLEEGTKDNSKLKAIASTCRGFQATKEPLSLEDMDLPIAKQKKPEHVELRIWGDEKTKTLVILCKRNHQGKFLPRSYQFQKR